MNKNMFLFQLLLFGKLSLWFTFSTVRCSRLDLIVFTSTDRQIEDNYNERGESNDGIADGCSSHNTADCTPNVHCGYETDLAYNVTSHLCELNEHNRNRTSYEIYSSFRILDLENNTFRKVILVGISFFSMAVFGLAASFVYCFRMQYSDRKLRQQIKVEACARGMKLLPLTSRVPKRRLEPIDESCSVIIADANVFIV